MERSTQQPAARRMILGRTGLEVNRLGFGGIPIQRVDEAEAVETVRHAVESGLDFIDTSRAYTTSERRIGLALKAAGVAAGRGPKSAGGPAPARRVVLASKTHKKSADGLRADLEVSLTELQRDYIDIYKAHFVATHGDYDTVVGAGGALEALVRARDEGLIGHIGLTSHNLEVLDRALDDELFDVIMVCFSFLETKARETIIPKARDKNIGILAMKPFSGGVIEDPRLALKYALAEPDVLVLAGVEHPRLFDQNWRIFREVTGSGPPPRDGASWLTDDEKQQIFELQQAYAKVFCRRCDYCQPCSEDIPIQTVLGVRTMVKRMGKDLFRQGSFWAAVQKGRDCTECGECTARCPYDLPIPTLIRENLDWLDELDGVDAQ